MCLSKTRCSLCWITSCRTVVWVFLWTKFSCSPSTPADCSQYNLPMCPRNFEPVCGSDGTNYSNECMLCFQNMERKTNILIRSKGEC
uniref:Serine peptidase inhibitor, Kazal type 2, tandem duplicate 1 n=1 Tax=Oncorhynchus tshawytscha TaxID=74940 RepID=A0AAZ3Q4P4_ONCTS